VIEGPPRRVLIEQAAHAELLVVGIHGSGDDSHSPPGTVARSLLHTSPCPVVLVPADGVPAEEVGGAAVFVAVDGTGKSVRALEWAVDAAVRRGAPLTIVHVWRGQAHDVDSEEYAMTHARAAGVLQDATAHAQQRAGVVVLQRLINGDAARVLPTVTNDADLVVVGSRGDYGLGSVAEAVVAKARRPVAVVTAGGTGGS
jgi:nucleotide-binding universal stress UspA family protein